MDRITPQQPQRLFDASSTRRLEQIAAAQLQPHTLMQRAGLAAAQLALALAPHARKVWIACGPGNNGGDGLEASLHLQRWGKSPVVTWLGNEASAPADALLSLARARAAGVKFSQAPSDLDPHDLCIDALLGIGSTRTMQGRLMELAQCLNASAAPVLALDLPSGLDADTGAFCGSDTASETQCLTIRAQHTLSLLTLKPGLFTAHGRDAAGQVWFDDLAVDNAAEPCTATLLGAPVARPRPHASHKGSYGDVAIVAGARDMTGAALLAARAALHAGAGRVYVALLERSAMFVDTIQPELMFRDVDTIDLQGMTVVCGCGAGDEVRAVLSKILAIPSALVLDADALNAIASETQLQKLLLARGQRGRITVLTPHPLEAARLLGCSAAQVQSQRLRSAQRLAEQFHCTVVLKGSGTVIADPAQTPAINPTGNARLATAGTGDVLAGMTGAALASGTPAFSAACEAVYRHGELADQWPAQVPLTASQLSAQHAPS
jgi:hydroxyethylthiazole kinase-like uncharacterized protein yjeF